MVMPTCKTNPAGRAGLAWGKIVGVEDVAPILVDSCGHAIVVDDWTPLLRSDVGANDSDKTFQVAVTDWEQVLWIWLEYTSSATAGTRQIVVQVQDHNMDVIGEWRAGTTQAASLTRNYCFAPANADLTAFRDTDYLMTPIPPTLILPSLFRVRVYDNNAIDVAADDMVLHMMVARRVRCV